jgi:hypothetical protein
MLHLPGAVRTCCISKHLMRTYLPPLTSLARQALQQEPAQ